MRGLSAATLVKDSHLRYGSGPLGLVFDDEPTIRAVIAMSCLRLGTKCWRALTVSGLSVINSRTQIDLLMSDVGVPNGMNGPQVADAAREKRPDLKVLFITSYAQQAVVRDGQLEPGIDHDEAFPHG